MGSGVRVGFGGRDWLRKSARGSLGDGIYRDCGGAYLTGYLSKFTELYITEWKFEQNEQNVGEIKNGVNYSHKPICITDEWHTHSERSVEERI